MSDFEKSIKEAVDGTFNAVERAGALIALGKVEKYIKTETDKLEALAFAASRFTYDPKWDDQQEVLKKVLNKIEEVRNGN